MKSLHQKTSLSTPATSQVPTTQPIPSHEERSVPANSSSLEFPSHNTSPTSSSTTTNHSPQPNLLSQTLTLATISHLGRSAPTKGLDLINGDSKKKVDSSPPSRTLGNRPATSQYPNTSPAPLRNIQTSTVNRYPSNLTPILSVLRPHCPARERLAKWCPASKRTFRDTTGHSLDLPDEFAERVQSVLTAGFAESTLETYASGLLAFHVFCDSREITELQRAPCSLDLLQSWIATMAGHYAGTSVKNYVHGVRAWHIIHGIEWKIDKAPIDAMIQGAERLQPERSKRKKRLPFTISYIESILTGLDPNDPFDAACGGCLTTSFYCAARVGELTVPNLRDFSASNHVTPSQMHETSDRNGFKTTILHIPCTKSNQSEGEDIYFSKQLGSSDPDWWLRNQLRVNDPGPSDHLFAYKHLSGRHVTLRPLTKSAFLRRIQKIAQTRGLPVIQGHGIRIGATLEYLLRGVPFDAVRVIGRWKSDAFLLYLRKHAEIMAPYLQPELHQSLIQYTMPPVRCKCSPLAWVSAVRWMRRALLPFGNRS
ncbi:hypothetical protein C8J55DRAFT_433358 [Lentinula edodes]|uniref:DNA breaking-rejoining enzyme n=1 Tax=Lentinula lateritia TaxID=40482 RepID=A0A9W9A3Z4_9AGAR|nr:hypothetical protein C8J55DRAFT_433358 [Lentinula edodes]